MKRDNSIDIAKGFGILLVVFAHICTNPYINRLIYNFHMPLFFFISGITIYYSLNKNENFFVFAKKKFKSIMIPYFVFSILSFWYWFIIERTIRNQLDISVLDNFINIFLMKIDMDLYTPNVVLWFLPCLFVVCILFYLMMKVKKGRSLLFLLCFILGYVLNINNLILPFTLETSLMMVTFVYLGYLFKCKDFKAINSIFVNILLIILFVVIFFLGNKVNILCHEYGNILMFIIGSLSGIILTLNLSLLFTKSKKLMGIFKYIGMNSLVIMCIHEPLKRIVLKVMTVILKVDMDLFRYNIFYSLLALFIIILISLPIVWVFDNYFYYLIGKKKREGDFKL